MRLAATLVVALVATPAWALPPPPTAQDAKDCKVAAYKAYPYQRPGSAPGSPARFEYFKDCLARRAELQQQQSPPQRQQ